MRRVGKLYTEREEREERESKYVLARCFLELKRLREPGDTHRDSKSEYGVSGYVSESEKSAREEKHRAEREKKLS